MKTEPVNNSQKVKSDEYYQGIIDAARLLATWGMDDGPRHLAESLLKTLVPARLLNTQMRDLDCEACGWSGQPHEDILPNQSIYRPRCHRAVWPEKYKCHKTV